MIRFFMAVLLSSSDTGGGRPPPDQVGYGFIGILVDEELLEVGSVTQEAVAFPFYLRVRKLFTSCGIDQEPGLLFVCGAQSQDRAEIASENGRNGLCHDVLRACDDMDPGCPSDLSETL